MIAALLLAWMSVASADEPSAQHITGRADDHRGGLDCATDPCERVLPGAVRFEVDDAKPYVTGYDPDGELVGWVALSTDVVDTVGYSSKPLVTAVGLDTEGIIVGARVVHHSEPILLVGIPEQRLHDFVDAHIGMPADATMVVGGKGDEPWSVDIVSGATVTVLNETETILGTARAVGQDVGVIEIQAEVPGHFVEAEPWTWAQMERAGALGHVTVSQAEMGEVDPEGRAFVDLVFAIADAPQIGIPLLGEGEYKWAASKLEEGEHLLVVFNSGSYSFKGSGFVRGGNFDRFRIEQGLRTLSFSDMDYTKLDSPPAEGAPELWEGGLFIARDSKLDPGMTFNFIFLGSTYATERGAFERDFSTFSVSHRVPRSVYVLDGPDPESLVWRTAWKVGWSKALGVGIYLLLLAGVFVARRWATGKMARLRTLHISAQAISFVVLGLWLHVQPSVTQLLTMVGSARQGWDWGLFLSDPVLFVSWIFIAVMIVIWGRGVFCGWACPYGAMNELTFKLARKLGIPEFEPPDWFHFKARYVRYGVFAFLLLAFLYDAEFGERMAEVEPFKSTFFVPLWTRHPALIAWWVVLFGWSVFTYRPFCRYLCPLGAALAVPSSFRISGPYRRNFCTKCKICAKGCEPRAIRSDGTIDPRECLNCWECEANWSDDQVCPPLVRARRDGERAAKKAATSDTVISTGMGA